MIAERRFRRLDSPELLADVYDGSVFVDGKGLVKSARKAFAWSGAPWGRLGGRMTTRHLSMPYVIAALNRGKAVEQLLSVTGDAVPKVVRYVALWQGDGGYVVSLHNVHDASGEGVLDVTEWPSVDESEEHGEGVWTRFASLEDAFTWLESELGASRTRFVNQGVIQDEVEEALGLERS
jgi:hypothetical protein